MPTARDHEAALERNPADNDAFVALRKAYRQASEHDKLITLYETRAQAIDDGSKAAELFYLAAELRLDQLNDAAGAESDLANAVHRDPTHMRAATRLKDLYREQGRTIEYMEMLELEAAAVAKNHEPARTSELHAEMGQLFVNHFARLERTIRNVQRPSKLSTEHIKTIESARKIYRALGDYRSVVRLYELELEGTNELKRRADLLLGLGRVLSEKLDELDAAAQRLSEVIRLRPRDEKALELLAATYANPNWIGADGAERAAGIFFQIARRRHEAGDIEGTVAAARKALGVVAGHVEASDLIERTYYDAHRFQDLDRYYRERVQAATTGEEQINFLYKRAQLAEGDLDDVAEAQRIYGEIAAHELPGGPAGERLAELYAEGHDYAKLAALREQQLGAVEDGAIRVRLMTELAELYGERLNDRDQAAVYLHAILQIEPGNEAALAAYAEHFREKNDWPALADLLDFALEQAHAAGATSAELVRRLEEIATVSEKNLNDTERALGAWRKVEELDTEVHAGINPAHSRAREMQKRILLKTKSFDRIVPILERESALAIEPAQRIEILRRIAQIQREKLGSPARAIEIYQEVLRLAPQDQVALRALVEIYEKQNDFAGLARTLRNQIAVAGSKQERVSLLRRLLVIYDERLHDVDAGAWAADEILRLVPGDRDTLARLEGLLAGAGDHAGLVRTLDYHAQYAGSPSEHIEILARAADLLGTALGDTAGAAARWEEVVRLDPEDGRALDALTAIYTRLEQHADLARILDAQVERLAGDPRQQADTLRRLAELCEAQLGDRPRARRAWEALSELLPSDPPALEALARIYTDAEEWATLVKILERQIPQVAAEPARALEIALRRAEILDVRLDNPKDAEHALEQIIAELDPRSWDAHARLRALYERSGDWPRVVKIAERQLFLTEDSDERVRRSLELGTLWRDRLHDDHKATGAFERAIEIAPRNLEALQALGPLYTQASDWDNLVGLKERLLDLAEGSTERRRLILEIAAIVEEHLQDATGAFEWYARAHRERPDAESLQLIDAVAEKHALFEELIGVYDDARTRATDSIEQLAASLKIATICEDKLGDPARAFATLRDSLAADPAGRELLPILERLAERTADWSSLLEVYARVARARPEVGERVRLLELRAQVREHRLADPSGALDELIRSFALDPRNAATHEEILRLASVTGRWEDELKVEAQLFALAEDLPRKLAVARHAAHLVETEVRDLVRAFHAYLNAFRIAPEDPDIVAHLWRLAGRIERYEDARPDEPASPIVAAVLDSAPDQTDRVLVVDEASVIGVAVDTESSSILEELQADDLELDESQQAPFAAEITRAATPPIPPPASGRRAPVSAGFQTPWEELAQAYDALPTPDSATRKRYLRKQSEVWEQGQKDVGRAVKSLERAFRLDPRDPAIRAELERIAALHGRWDQICDIYLGAIDELGPAEHAISIHREVARFREALGETARAEERYHAILELDPADRRALDRLEQIAREQERWAELAEILERRTDGDIAPLPQGPDRRAKLTELADIYENRLEKPYEAIDTLERLVTEAADESAIPDPLMTEQALAACESLTRLYGRVGLWAKAVEALQREAELTSNPSASRQLRLRIADTFERELGQSDRAIEVFEAISLGHPGDAEALAALDRLYEAHGRWDDLQNTLADRASLATDPAEHIELVRRRARILEERLDSPDAAAAALRELGDAALADRQLASMLIRNLRRAGLGHEAALTLETQIDTALGAASPPAEIVSLLLELASVRGDDLEDEAGARQAIADALAISPEDASALDVLARIELKGNRFPEYAATRRREARALTDTALAVASLLEAGRVYRDQADGVPDARACFEEAVERDPTSVEAVRALAALHASEGEWFQARQRLERQLELVDSPDMRAAVLTDLARSIWEGSGNVAEAQKHLDEAMELAPDHLQAVLTAADIYYKDGQWALAEKRLTEAVRRLRSSPEQAASLYLRLAEVSERLGRIDEAHRQLAEADRLAPGQLSIRLALGENRFRAGKWREVSAVLGNLADHPDAARQPDEVADGLAHAAQAEIKLRRPERALALYQAAFGLRPNHAPSLRAMADLALESGDRTGARGYLERLAVATGDREARTLLLEQLGDLYLDAGETAKARDAYESAARLYDRPHEAQIKVLEKALAMQREANDVEAASQTASQLIELVQDPKERALRRREAATLIAAQGEGEQALVLMEAAFADNPQDDTVLASLCDLLTRQGKHKLVARRLAAALPDLLPPADNLGARQLRASLWERLGEARKKKDPAEAIAAFERAIELDPDRVGTRIALAALYGPKVEFADAALANLRRLVATDPTRPESLRAFASAFADRGLFDPARCAYELLEVLGGADDETQVFLKAHPLPDLKADDPYAAVLDDQDRRALGGPEAEVLAEIFTLLWEGAPHLLNERLEDLEVTAEDKISPMSDLDVGKVYSQIGKALGNKKAALYLKRSVELPQMAIVVQIPPALVFGAELLAAPLTTVRFELARGLELSRPEYVLAAGVRPRQFTELFGNVLRAFHPRHAKRRAPAADAIGERAAALRKNVPYKLSKRLVEVFQEMEATPWSSVRWRKAVGAAGMRTGLVMSGDVGAAIRGVLRAGKQAVDGGPQELAQLARSYEPLGELLRFALSEDYFKLREKVGTAAIRAAAA